MRLAAAAGLATALAAAPAAAEPAVDPAVARAWIEAFKASPQGPFQAIRWFCNDGAVLPARVGCRGHGDGIQHGEWDARARALRGAGYAIANVLAEVEPEPFVGPDAELGTLAQILLERFLVGWDDGWIFRGARGYRGALQIEDEAAGARRLLLAMLADPAWREPARFALLREAARLLPLHDDEGTAAHVRRLAADLARRDAAFAPLRSKIHGFPDAGDAERVRAYESRRGRRGLGAEYAALADAIDRLYSGDAAVRELARVAAETPHEALRAAFAGGAAILEPGAAPSDRLLAASELLAVLRDAFPTIADPAAALAVLQASLALENAAFAAGHALAAGLDAGTRRQRLALLEPAAKALYGAGFVTRRHLLGVRASRERIEAEDPSLRVYLDELRYLARVPEWCARWLAFHFAPAIERLAPLDPAVRLYPQDRLRGSPLLLYAAAIDSLVSDAQRLAGIEHDFFGRRIGAGLRALNPGIARGVLRSGDGAARFEPDGIYVLPETIADLPPVAGILTRGEGSSLSHVQLLARNLGIPNVVVAEPLLPELLERAGERVVLAVSPGGVVQLAADSARWDAVAGSAVAPRGGAIHPDLEKLDANTLAMIPLSALRASDSGRLVGPKAANLGELMHHFGLSVPDGFAIPFGAFRRLLDQPLEPGGPPVFTWMQERYAAIERLAARPDEQRREVARFLARLRAWILAADPGPAFRRALRARLEASFGADGASGVYVRSDTNVEDLPGFTGAGLNLTVPNVVGYEEALAAIREVWASPFTERAFAWRQAHMERPEYVFPSVVVQRAFPAEKSGVMVTLDVDTGEPGSLTIAVNEGVGGAVEGQASESLVVPLEGGRVRYLAQASAPERRVLSPGGGVRWEPASGSQAILSQEEVVQLVALARRLDGFAALRGEDGAPLVADVEFAFRGGELALLQIRPFVESRRARHSVYLHGLDASLRGLARRAVALDAVPLPARVGGRT